ncbi:hypothetical protein C2E23DRAFT_174419 [Lenzites betulinus]|nr:hypothetical protein C2E23DRAFT_174419 [Lenzites betulinus]
MELNNLIQKNQSRNISVRWDEQATGPQNAPTWTARVFINEMECGRGSALNINGAREIAAEHAVRMLWAHGPR